MSPVGFSDIDEAFLLKVAANGMPLIVFTPARVAISIQISRSDSGHRQPEKNCRAMPPKTTALASLGESQKPPTSLKNRPYSSLIELAAVGISDFRGMGRSMIASDTVPSTVLNVPSRIIGLGLGEIRAGQAA
jgi:hypothetical protein